jgi:hypothetical protein
MDRSQSMDAAAQEVMSRESFEVRGWCRVYFALS